MCASGDIFKAKVYSILGYINVVEMYINNILVFSNGSFSKHIIQLRLIFARLRIEGLKVNFPK